MSGVGDLFSEGFSAFREGVNRSVDGHFDDGYNEAAHTCIRILSEKIDDLLHQIKSGRYLSEQEQFLLSSLNEIRLETEVALRAFYDDPVGE